MSYTKIARFFAAIFLLFFLAFSISNKLNSAIANINITISKMMITKPLSVKKIYDIFLNLNWVMILI